MATKTKTKKIDSLYPPKELQDQYGTTPELKALSPQKFAARRKEWLAATAAEINAQPGRMAKIVGGGSYASVSVYEVTETEGRLRHRGICQLCGASQVVQEGRMVLHGYRRPGWGNVVGRCPGTNEAPLNHDDALTLAALDSAIRTHEESKKDLSEAERAEKQALAVRYPDVSSNLEEGAYTARPSQPSERKAAQDATLLPAYVEALKAWAKQYPLSGALDRAKARHAVATNDEYRSRQIREHFQRLIDLKIKGTPLTEEVVA